MVLFQIGLAVIVLSVLTAPAEAQSAIYIESQNLTEAFAKPGNLVNEGGYRVQTSRRVKPGSAEVHEKDTDIFYIVDGAATFVTGGSVIQPKSISANQILGAGINGGGEPPHLKWRRCRDTSGNSPLVQGSGRLHQLPCSEGRQTVGPA